MKKVRVLFVLPNLNTGGAEKVTITLMNEMDNSRFECGLFLFSSKGNLRELISRKITVFTAYKNSYCSIIKSLYYVSSNFDIIIPCGELLTTYISIFIARMKRKRCIPWIHTNIFDSILEYSFWKRNVHKVFIYVFYKKANAVMTVSNGIKRELISRLNLKNDNIYCVYTPKNISLIMAQAKDKLPKIDGRPLVVYVGRLETIKNVDLIIDVIEIIKQRYSDLKLMIIGDGSDKERLVSYVKNKKMEKNVDFMGFRINPYPYIKCADLLLMASEYEGLPTVITEAQALGTLVAAVDCPSGGVRELLEDGKSGILLDSYDVKKIARVIEDAMENGDMINSMLCQAMKSSREYDSKIVVKNIERIILNCVKVEAE